MRSKSSPLSYDNIKVDVHGPPWLTTRDAIRVGQALEEFDLLCYENRTLSGHRQRLDKGGIAEFGELGQEPVDFERFAAAVEVVCAKVRIRKIARQHDMDATE